MMKMCVCFWYPSDGGVFDVEHNFEVFHSASDRRHMTFNRHSGNQNDVCRRKLFFFVLFVVVVFVIVSSAQNLQKLHTNIEKVTTFNIHGNVSEHGTFLLFANIYARKIVAVGAFAIKIDIVLLLLSNRFFFMVTT